MKILIIMHVLRLSELVLGLLPAVSIPPVRGGAEVLCIL